MGSENGCADANDQFYEEMSLDSPPVRRARDLLASRVRFSKGVPPGVVEESAVREGGKSNTEEDARGTWMQMLFVYYFREIASRASREREVVSRTVILMSNLLITQALYQWMRYETLTSLARA